MWKPLSVSRVCDAHGTCLIAVSDFFALESCWSFLSFLHRHDDVTPSLFRALESYVLRVLDGNEIKLGSSPSLSVFTVFVDLFFIHTISVGLISGCSIEQYFCCIFIVQRHPIYQQKWQHLPCVDKVVHYEENDCSLTSCGSTSRTRWRGRV